MNASHFINLFTNSRHPISTNSKLLRTHINLQQPQFLYSLRRRANARNVTAFQIFHGGHSTFINSFDKINFCWYFIPSIFWTCGEAELYDIRRTDSSIKRRCILQMDGYCKDTRCFHKNSIPSSARIRLVCGP